MLSVPHPTAHGLGVLLIASALGASACGSSVTVIDGEGGNANTGGNNTGAGNTGGNNTGAGNTGGSVPVDCVSANNLDPCSSPGSYCSYYDASTNEYCDGYCDEGYHWQKYCYVEPTYCYNPSLCPATMPNDGGFCVTTPQCEVYDCEYAGVCGGSGYGMASCYQGTWQTFSDCYCYQPPNLCPSSPPQSGSPCATTQQCQTYECEWYANCGNNTYDYAYCELGVWYAGGDCSN